MRHEIESPMAGLEWLAMMAAMMAPVARAPVIAGAAPRRG